MCSPHSPDPPEMKAAWRPSLSPEQGRGPGARRARALAAEPPCDHPLQVLSFAFTPLPQHLFITVTTAATSTHHLKHGLKRLHSWGLCSKGGAASLLYPPLPHASSRCVLAMFVERRSSGCMGGSLASTLPLPLPLPSQTLPTPHLPYTPKPLPTAGRLCPFGSEIWPLSPFSEVFSGFLREPRLQATPSPPFGLPPSPAWPLFPFL